MPSLILAVQCAVEDWPSPPIQQSAARWQGQPIAARMLPCTEVRPLAIGVAAALGDLSPCQTLHAQFIRALFALAGLDDTWLSCHATHSRAVLLRTAGSVERTPALGFRTQAHTAATPTMRRGGDDPDRSSASIASCSTTICAESREPGPSSWRSMRSDAPGRSPSTSLPRRSPRGGPDRPLSTRPLSTRVFHIQCLAQLTNPVTLQFLFQHSIDQSIAIGRVVDAIKFSTAQTREQSASE